MEDEKIRKKTALKKHKGIKNELWLGKGMKTQMSNIWQMCR